MTPRSIKTRHAPEDWETIHRRANRMEDMLRTFKARETRIAGGLHQIATAIEETNWAKSKDLIVALTAEDLKAALEDSSDRELALRVAIEVLEECRDRKWTAITNGSGPEDATPNEKGLFSYVGETNAAAHHALEQMHKLAPEAFEAPAAVTVGVAS